MTGDRKTDKSEAARRFSALVTTIITRLWAHWRDAVIHRGLRRPGRASRNPIFVDD